MRVLDLFSGIGGFSLGLERAGMRTVAFCEIDPYCRAVLAKHWPGIPIHDDIRDLTAHNIGVRAGVDLICGGFPCQDISVAGKGAGLAGERSGLWREYFRLIRELRPRYVIVENVSALLSRGLGEVLGDLAAIGYDAEWHCIPASYVGAPHRRDRVWIIAYPDKRQMRGVRTNSRNGREIQAQGQQRDLCGSDGREDVADSNVSGLQRYGRLSECAYQWTSRKGGGAIQGWWESEPDVGRVAHGVPSRVDRLRALGNAVVPQVVEIIGRAIMRAEGL